MENPPAEGELSGCVTTQRKDLRNPNRVDPRGYIRKHRRQQPLNWWLVKVENINLAAFSSLNADRAQIVEIFRECSNLCVDNILEHMGPLILQLTFHKNNHVILKNQAVLPIELTHLNIS